MDQPLLAVEDLVKQFPAVRALDGVTLALPAGRVTGIIGENGAGKSTLMKILSGVEQPTAGRVLIRGEPVVLPRPADALRRGIVMIHQELNLVDELTVADNICLGREPRRGMFVDDRRSRSDARRLLETLGATIDPAVRVRDLSIAQQQMVEIAKALSYDASVVIMDEPTAVLTRPEAEALFRVIRALRRRGVAVAYISHILPDVIALADDITVLRDGQVVGRVDPTGRAPAEHARLPATLANMMVGRELTGAFPPRRPAPVGDVVLQITDLVAPPAVRGATLSVERGEILGLAGLVGSGRTELAEAACGLRPRRGGRVEMDGALVRAGRPRDAVTAGMAYLSEDRKGRGLILGMDAIANTTIVNLDAYASPGPVNRLLDRGRERTATEGYVRTLDVRVGDLRADVATLSGGNQQKIALAKWLEMKPKLLFLDEPTRGIDVGAKSEIYELIHRLAADGTTCVVISSELLELIGLCDRIAVMRKGRLAGEVSGDRMREEDVIRLAAGVAEGEAA